jgi:hypothetical protein
MARIVVSQRDLASALSLSFFMISSFCLIPDIRSLHQPYLTACLLSSPAQGPLRAFPNPNPSRTRSPSRFRSTSISAHTPHPRPPSFTRTTAPCRLAPTRPRCTSSSSDASTSTITVSGRSSRGRGRMSAWLAWGGCGSESYALTPAGRGLGWSS